MQALAGKYYSAFITTGSEVVGQDLMSDIRTALGVDHLTAKKMTFICSSGSVSVDINATGVYSALWGDSSGSYKLNLDEGDIFVNSFKVKESGRACYVSIIY